MAFTAERRIDRKYSGDAMDRALAIAWIGSEIVFEIFGRFFWAAFALLALRAFA
jgi:hypothetical protein